MPQSAMQPFIQTFTYLGKEHKIRCFKDENNITWTMASDFCKSIGLRGFNPLMRKQKISKLYKMVTNGGKMKCRIINEDCIKQIICRSLKPAAVAYATLIGIDVHSHLFECKESQTISKIMKAFIHEDMITQRPCGKYRIDLYIPKYKLAIECDEDGHKNRDQNYEYERQQLIQNELNCKFIRFNPDSNDFCIFNVIGEIYSFIMCAQ